MGVDNAPVVACKCAVGIHAVALGERAVKAEDRIREAGIRFQTCRLPVAEVRRGAQDVRFPVLLLSVVSSRTAEPFPNASHTSALTEVCRYCACGWCGTLAGLGSTVLGGRLQCSCPSALSQFRLGLTSPENLMEGT